MRNFEKDFDRLLNNLQEATIILKDCNFEMQKCLSETQAIKYALYMPETDMYYNSNIRTFIFKLKNAKLYSTLTFAKQELEILEKEDPEIKGRIEIKIIQLKVVE